MAKSKQSVITKKQRGSREAKALNDALSKEFTPRQHDSRRGPTTVTTPEQPSDAVDEFETPWTADVGMFTMYTASNSKGDKCVPFFASKPFSQMNDTFIQGKVRMLTLVICLPCLSLSRILP